jgi:hypothetical protein
MSGSRLNEGACVMRRVEEKTTYRLSRFCHRLSSMVCVQVVLLLGAVAARPAGQVPVLTPPNPQNQFPLGQNPHQRSPFDNSELDPQLVERQLRALNVERQKTMVTDTDRILKLAQEINFDLGSGSSNALTSAELRKIADIEKLARDVKQKMSSSLIGAPSYHDPGPPLMR